jgi:hypothetical protein
MLKVKAVTKAKHQELIAEDCPICRETHDVADIVQTTCGHILGKLCYQTWETQCKTSNRPVTCPCCRTETLELIGFRLRGKKTPEMKLQEKKENSIKKHKHWMDVYMKRILYNQRELQILHDPKIVEKLLLQYNWFEEQDNKDDISYYRNQVTRDINCYWFHKNRLTKLELEDK